MVRHPTLTWTWLPTVTVVGSMLVLTWLFMGASLFLLYSVDGERFAFAVALVKHPVWHKPVRCGLLSLKYRISSE
jgi:hypothetical protein